MANKSYPPNGSRSPESKARREAHWRTVLERWRRSGLAKTEFSSREGISRDVLSWWQAQIARRDLARGHKRSAIRPEPIESPGRPAFVSVRVVEPPSSPSSTALEVIVGDRIVRVRPDFDPNTLGRLLAVLEGREC